MLNKRYKNTNYTNKYANDTNMKKR